MTTLFPADDSIGSNCKSCGAAITPTVKFCPECGATQTSRPVKATAPSVPSEEPPFTHHTPALTSDDESLHQPSQPRSLASHRLLWLGIAFVVIALASVGSWAWLSKPPTTAKAQYELGKKYYYGNGVKKDVAEAVRWYRKAADQGDATAQSALGDAYMEGNGVQSDWPEAVKWFRKAADQGDAKAQYDLGLLYRTGTGVQQDDAQAIVWYQKAAAQGYEDAKEPLSRLLAKQQEEQGGTAVLKQQEQERQQAVYGEQIDYPTFFAKIHTGLPIGKRYRFNAILSHDLCLKSDMTTGSHLFCGTRADFDNQAEYESLLRGPDNVSGTIIASMGADGTVNIHAFQ